MKEIHLGNTIKRKRRENHITQDELAAYVGVSKAAISKWENDQSYPDLTLLPVLAAYFNMSIDDLMGYQPQMEKEDISKLYKDFCEAFAKESFDEVLQRWEETVKKYQACYPLILQMGILLLNHLNLAAVPEQLTSLQERLLELFVRVEKESHDANLMKQAIGTQAYCYHLMNQPEAVIDLLDGCTEPKMSSEVLLASAYQVKGNQEKAEEILQSGIYQTIVMLIGMMQSMTDYPGDNQEKRQMWINSFRHIEAAFQLKEMHPTLVITFYLVTAQSCLMQQEEGTALEMLKEYEELVRKDIFPLQLKGSLQFDKIDKWIQELELGSQAPRNDYLIKQSMIEAVEMLLPMFSNEENKKQVEDTIQRLKVKLEIEGGNKNG